MTTADLFEEAGAALLAETGCTVRKWRTKTTGVAYTNADDWGIEAPRPRGALSFATFAHEVAHQVLHRRNSKPRWLEEIEAWEWALAQFDRFDLPGVLVAQEDAAECLVVSARRADRRGLSVENAGRLLRRYPDWVWADSERVMVAVELVEHAEARDLAERGVR